MSGRLALFASALLLVVAFASPEAALADREAHGGLFRDPDVSKTHVVFVYADDLWLVPRAGGTATPLASPAGVERFPRFSPEGRTIAFMGRYDDTDDVYTVPTAGGVPHRVTWHPNTEYLCDWTADGRLLFAMPGLHGSDRVPQVFTVDAAGGLPQRLPIPYGIFATLHPDGRRIAYQPAGTARENWKRYRGGQAPDIWVVDLEAKTSKRITTWEGSDGQPMWRGETIYYISDAGPAHRQNVWVYDLETGKRRQVTRFERADVRTPAIGPGAKGQGEIVFQLGTGLHLLDLSTERVTPLKITIPGARPQLRKVPVDVSKAIEEWEISPTGKRALVEARGDVWTLPAKKGPARNLTRTSGVAERDPAWSPDGRWIAYFSDASGEYELCIRRSDGRGEERRLTRNGDAFRFNPTWAPDSKRIAFTDKAARLFVHDLESDATVPVDADQVVEDEGMGPVSWSRDGRWLAYARAADGARNRCIYLWDRTTGESTRVTTPLYSDRLPTFDREGDWLFFVSSRAFRPTYADLEETFVYSGTEVIVAAPLRADVENPYAPTSDEEEIEDDEATDEEEKAAPEKGPAAADDGVSGTWTGTAVNDEFLPPGGLTFTLVLEVGADGSLAGTLTTPLGTVEILEGSYDEASGKVILRLEDEEGTEWRVEATVTGDAVTGVGHVPSLGVEVRIEGKRTAKGGSDDGQDGKEGKGKRGKKNREDEPVEIELEGFEARGFQLPIERGNFGRLAVNHQGALIYSRRPPGGSGREPSIHLFKMEAGKRAEEDITSGTGRFRVSADGKQMLIIREDAASIQKAGPGGGKPVPKVGLEARIDPRAEWRQLVQDAWRIMRDYFYDPHMHGVDWPSMRDRYLAMVDDCVTREDVSHVITEMIGELNVGHANHWIRPPWRRGGGRGTGMLGVDWTLEKGAYRIARIVKAAPWDVDVRGPLDVGGLDVKEGDYLLAVNGVPMDVSRAPWAAFDGLVGSSVTLTVSENPTLDAEARRVVVKPMASERRLRYRDWIEKNRRYVEERTDGRVGYLYVPNTGWNGQNELIRQLQGQLKAEALIVDERWNSGGQIPTRFIELLNRPVLNYWARRDGLDWPCPYFGHRGPKCMLMNGNSGSGGDAFPHYFREAGLGKLIGTRTWGGLVGISGNPGLIDGSYVSVPTFAFYENDGTWGIEGHGVDPDLEVVDDPAKMLGGGDPQLDAAIDLMLDELRKGKEWKPPARPAYPDRSGMGVAPEDK